MTTQDFHVIVDGRSVPVTIQDIPGPVDPNLLKDLPTIPPRTRVPSVRPAHKLLVAAHGSVGDLLASARALSEARRGENGSRQGRPHRREVDILRSAIVFAGAGLDATLKRLLNDAGRALLGDPTSGASKQYIHHMKSEVRNPSNIGRLSDAVTHRDASNELIAYYFSGRTKTSFQGSSDVKSRAIRTLGLSSGTVPDEDFVELDHFFQQRNAIVHEMDYRNLSGSTKERTHRTIPEVAALCSVPFSVAATIILATADILQKTTSNRS